MLTHDPYAPARFRMVEEQIVARGVRNPRVVDALRMVPRHDFVPLEERIHAYEDRPLEIGAAQAISQPYMVAIMTAALDPSPNDRVLEVGTGSGYQAAVFGWLAAEVVSIERVEELAVQARLRLSRLGLNNVTVHVGDGSAGWPDGKEFDGILVTAGAPQVPAALLSQLADGGRLVVPVGSRTRQELLVIRREGEKFHEERREGCVFVPLFGRFGWDA